MRAAIYARKSQKQTDASEEEKSVTRQESGARAFIGKKEWTITTVYKDPGVSGALFSTRPGWQHMLRDAAAGAFDAIVCYRFDRLGRSQKQTRRALEDLDDLGIQVWDYSRERRLSLDTFADRVQIMVESEGAEQYVQSIRELTRDAMHNKARLGVATGRPPFGYAIIETPEKQKLLVINEPEAQIVRDAFERKGAGAGDHSIAKWLNKTGRLPRPWGDGKAKWNTTTVRRLWTRELYRGFTIYGKHWVNYSPRKPGTITRGRFAGKLRDKRQELRPESEWVKTPMPHLRIVDEETCAKVDARLKEKREQYEASKITGKAKHKSHGHYLLSGGMLICPQCSAHFEARHGTAWGGRGVYVCSSRRRHPGTCKNMLALPIDETDNIVLDQLENAMLDPQYVESLLSYIEDSPDDSARLSAEKEELGAEIRRLLDSIAQGIPAVTVAPAVQEREAQIAKIDVALARPRKPNVNREKMRAVLQQQVADWREALRAEPAIAREVLREVIGPITMWEAEVVTVPEEFRKDIPGKPHWTSLPGEVPAPGDGPPVLRWSADLKPPAHLEPLRTSSW